MENPQDRSQRQRLTAILTLEAMSEAGAKLRPMIELIGPEGEATAVMGWPGHGETPRDRAFDLSVALSVAALYQPIALCVVMDARMKTLSPTEELPEGYDRQWLANDPEAEDCLLLMRSDRKGSTIEVLPYGRDDTGRLIWKEVPEPLREAPLGEDPIGRVLTNFWSPEAASIWMENPTPEDRNRRLIAARLYLPGLQVCPFADLLEAEEEDE